jgi:hypothetical protein
VTWPSYQPDPWYFFRFSDQHGSRRQAGCESTVGAGVQSYLDVEVHLQEDSMVLRVTGELDLRSAPKLEQAVDPARAAGRS